MNAADQILAIDTPENVVFGYEVAGIGSRFLAALIDSALIALLLVVANLTLVFILAAAGAGAGVPQRAWSWVAALFGLVSFGFLWGYYIFFEMMWNGQSPGKRWLGLRVLRADGTPIGLSEAIIRNLIRIVDFLPAYYGVGVITMFFNEEARRLGDLAAGTLVVYDRGEVTLASLETRALPSLPAGELHRRPAGPPVERLERADVALAEAFLQRRHQLANGDAVARELATALLAKMGEAPARPLTAEEARALLQLVAQGPAPAPPPAPTA